MIWAQMVGRSYVQVVASVDNSERIAPSREG
jgi:hypothetical protein